MEKDPETESLASQSTKDTTPKEEDIERLGKILSSSSPDLHNLREFGRTTGFLNTGLRAKAYMALLSITHDHISDTAERMDTMKYFQKDEVLDNDIKRSLCTISTSVQLDKASQERKKEQLSNMISFFITKHTGLSYYQGFNFLGEVMLLNFGKILGYCFLEKLGLHYFCDYFTSQNFNTKLQEHISKTFASLLHYYPDTVYKLKIDPDLENERDLIGKLSFVVSWFLCWFSYKLTDLDSIVRIFDYLISSGEASVGILASVVIGQMFESDPSIDEDTEHSDLMNFCFNYPMDTLDWERAFCRTSEIHRDKSKVLHDMMQKVSDTVKSSKLGQKSLKAIYDRLGGKQGDTVVAKNVVKGLAIGVGFVGLLSTIYLKSKSKKQGNQESKQ